MHNNSVQIHWPAGDKHYHKNAVLDYYCVARNWNIIKHSSCQTLHWDSIFDFVKRYQILTEFEMKQWWINTQKGKAINIGRKTFMFQWVLGFIKWNKRPCYEKQLDLLPLLRLVQAVFVQVKNELSLTTEDVSVNASTPK